MKVKVGHDSEAFAKRPDNLFYPMIGAIGGTKERPLPVPGGNLQEDNVSIEMAVDATSDIDEFVERTQNVYKEMEKKVQEQGMELVVQPSVEFTEAVIEAFLPESVEQGCDPDFNIYTKCMNLYPPLEESLFRHGSGHIHMDCPAALEPKGMSHLIMLSDLLIKAPQWLLEGSVERNNVQGALGNYRPKSYGCEYRSSSNIILKDESALRHAFKAAQYASKWVQEGRAANPEDIVRLKYAIRKDNKDKVVRLIQRYGGEVI